MEAEKCTFLPHDPFPHAELTPACGTVISACGDHCSTCGCELRMRKRVVRKKSALLGFRNLRSAFHIIGAYSAKVDMSIPALWCKFDVFCRYYMPLVRSSTFLRTSCLSRSGSRVNEGRPELDICSCLA